MENSFLDLSEFSSKLTLLTYSLQVLVMILVSLSSRSDQTHLLRHDLLVHL